MPSKRRTARIAVLQTLFEDTFPGRAGKLDATEVLTRNMEEQGEGDLEFALSLLEGTQDHWDDIIDTIQTHAPQWPLERMESIARSLLMMGTYELCYAEDAPAAVVMNEAIEIAKQFGEEETGKFVNGVLNAIAKAQQKN